MTALFALRIPAGTCALLLFSCIPASGLVNLGQNGTIDLGVTTSLTYDSHISGRESSNSDVIARERITLNYNRPSRRFEISASLGIQATQYFDTSDLNSENVVFDLSLTPGLETRNSRFVISADLIFDTTTETDFEVGQVITTRTYGANANLLYTPTRRYGASADASYSRKDPDSGFSEQDIYTVSGSVFRVQSEVLQFSMGGTYSETHILNDRLRDNETITAFVGASGALFPKVTGSVNVGATRSKSTLTDASTAPYLSASLNWLIDDATTLSMGANNNFSTGVNGSRNRQFSLTTALQRTLSQRAQATIGVSYSRSKFDSTLSPSRSDTSWNYNASLSYQIAKWGSLQLTTHYTQNDSDSSTFVYGRLIASLSLSASW
jgi:hypothetical protein